MIGHIISVGDELLAGRIVDSNSAYIAQQLTLAGVEVTKMVTVGDEPASIVAALNAAATEAQIIVVTGGLGPTNDDRTRHALAEFARVPLELNPTALDALIRRYKERKWGKMPEINRIQAYLPAGATPMINEHGSACGIRQKVGQTIIYTVPGVPFEMRNLVDQQIIPDILKISTNPPPVVRFLKSSGVGESNIYEKIKDIIETNTGKIEFSFYPHRARHVDICLTVKNQPVNIANAWLDAIQPELEARLGDHIFAVSTDPGLSLETLVPQMLIASGKTIAVAESCTGGLLADTLTDVPGASAYFLTGVTAYSNDSKIKVLGVAEQLIIEHGAVSEAVATAMAAGMRQLADSDVALSTTGIAGPTGGTAEKPVGQVYIGFANRTHAYAHKYIFTGDRRYHKIRTVHVALKQLWQELRTAL